MVIKIHKVIVLFVKINPFRSVNCLFNDNFSIVFYNVLKLLTKLKYGILYSQDGLPNLGYHVLLVLEEMTLFRLNLYS